MGRAGSWARIRFLDAANDAQCVMTNCTIRYGGGYLAGEAISGRKWDWAASSTPRSAETQMWD